MCERGKYAILTSKIQIFFLLLFIFKISILMSCVVVGSLNDDRSAIRLDGIYKFICLPII